MASEVPDEYYMPHGHATALAIVPAYELSETAIKLSRVIEHEAQRRSTMRSPSLFRVEQNFPIFQRVNSRLRSSLAQSSMRSKRSVTSVAPTPEDREVDSPAPRSSLVSGPLETIRSASPQPSPRASIKQGRQSISRGPESEFSEDIDVPLTLRGRVWEFFDDPQSSVGAYYFSVSLFFFIALSTVVFIAQTEKSLDPYREVLDVMEAVCAAVFTVEYSLRAISAPSKWAFIKYFGNWVDLAAILPFYLEVILQVENAGSFGAIRIVRLTRVARVLKMSRYSSAIQVFVQAIAISVKALSMLVFLMGIAVVVFSSAIYFAEYTPDGCRQGGWLGDCNDAVSVVYVGSIGAAAATGPALAAPNRTVCVCVDPNPYSSIAASFWWSIVTMSTVGYGDMTPVTVPGRIVGMATILTGMLVLALPITVIGTNFQKVMKSVMQQTMKSNVDYLKGKKQICRQEIQAILQRFHAVTTDIHLDIDDIIRVYDTDKSGTLEDDELARFRNDLEMLQNRAFHNQHMDLGAPPAAVAVTTPIVPSGNSRAFGSMMRKFSGRRLSSFLAPPPGIQRKASVSPLKDDQSARMMPRSTPSPSPRKMSTTPPVVRLSKSEPSNLIAPTEQPRIIPGGADAEHSPKSPESHQHSDVKDIQTSPRSINTRRASGPSIDELVGDEIEKMLASPSSPVGGETSEDMTTHEKVVHEETHSPSRSRQSSHSHSHHNYHHHGRQQQRADDDLILKRIEQMQRTFEKKLIETEARIDEKLLHLTKILMHVETMVELNDD